MNTDEDTIAAIATAPGEGGISIVRISGPQSLQISDQVFAAARGRPSQCEGGRFLYGHTHDQLRRIDEALLLVMRKPASYTCEDMVEIQGHGGEQSARRNLRVVLQAGARLAEPGEFTKRAFLHGRLDLVQAEAVLDLIRAKSDRAASAALEQLDGSLSEKFNRLYDDMVSVAANLEATLDFPEDELPPIVMEQITSATSLLQEQFQALLSTWDEGHLLREGAIVVIAGKPNVGKSTMLNQLLGMDRAIVTSIPGTTRDVIEEGLVVAGIPLRLVDTAGLRETEDVVEMEGIRRTRSHLEKADLTLYMVDVSTALEPDDEKQLDSLDPDQTVVVLNKTDLGEKSLGEVLDRFTTVSCSLVSGMGLDGVRTALEEVVRRSTHAPVEPRAVISERHRGLVVQAAGHVQEVVDLLKQEREEVVVLAAAQLRAGLELLGTATGRTYHDELLDRIFSRFCIGK